MSVNSKEAETALVALSREDRFLVDRAVRDIRAVWQRGLLATVVTAGECLIDHFFDGSLDLALSRQPSKPAALSHLYQRVDELPIGLHQLRLAVRIALQWHSLPQPLSDALSVSHHEALLPLPHGEAKLALARRAVDERLSAATLAKLVRQIQPRHAGGRPPLPAVERWVRSVSRAVDARGLERLLDERGFERLGADDLGALERELRHARDTIERALDACVLRRAPSQAAVARAYHGARLRS